MPTIKPPPPPGDLLYGIAAIAAFLGVTQRQALYLKEKGALPHWREGRTICARRTTVSEWLVQREVAARERSP